MKRRHLLQSASALAFTGGISFGAAAETDAATKAKLQAALNGPQRSAESKARDKYRHPAETLEFFGFNSKMTVVEIGPGGGWWTEILAPALKDTGRYVAAQSDPEASEGSKKALDAFKAKLAEHPEAYSKAEIGVLSPRTNKLNPVPPGTADMVVTFRNIHNWMAADQQDIMFKSFYDSLRQGGYLGVEEHRAPNDKPQDPKAANGYVREDTAIAIAERAGFRFVKKAEINANPKDTKDYPKGVWTLPPTYVEKDVDKAKYTAIGESDRFTMLFQKPTA